MIKFRQKKPLVSPVSFCIPLKDYVIQNNPNVVNDCHSRVNAKAIKWNSENSEVVNGRLNSTVPELQNTLEVKFDPTEDVNSCVKHEFDVETLCYVFDTHMFLVFYFIDRNCGRFTDVPM